MFAALFAAAALGQFGIVNEGVRGVPGQPIRPVVGKVEQVPATEHYLPFGVMFEPASRSAHPNAPRYHGEITTPTFVHAQDPALMRSPTGTYQRPSTARPAGFASRATVPNRGKTLREMRYGSGPVPGSRR